MIGTSTGTFARSTTYATPPVGWIPTPFTLGTPPTCAALGSDSGIDVADAGTWNPRILTRNAGNLLAIPLQNLIFARGPGSRWQMSIPINFGGNQYNDVQLGLLENAATRGDDHSTYPVLQWLNQGYTGGAVLQVRFEKLGRFQLGVFLVDHLANHSMAVIDCIVIL